MVPTSGSTHAQFSDSSPSLLVDFYRRLGSLHDPLDKTGWDHRSRRGLAKYRDHRSGLERGERRSTRESSLRSRPASSVDLGQTLRSHACRKSLDERFFLLLSGIVLDFQHVCLDLTSYVSPGLPLQGCTKMNPFSTSQRKQCLPSQRPWSFSVHIQQLVYDPWQSSHLSPSHALRRTLVETNQCLALRGAFCENVLPASCR